jgi:dipeptidyl aminopeptidase/acylaminoacyl peptidase
MSLNGGSLRQLTDIRTSGGAAAPPLAFGGGGGRRGADVADGIVASEDADFALQQAAPPKQDEKKKQTSQEYLKQEERKLLEYVNERAQNREEQEAKRKKLETRKPFDLPSGQSVANLTLAPDGKTVTASVIQTAQGDKRTIVPNYVTESAYTEDIPARTKVGDAQSAARIALINVATGEVKYVEHNPSADAKAPAPKLNWLNLQFNEANDNAAVIVRSADNKDRWVLAVDVTTGKTVVLDHLHDDAWIGGPGSFTLGWLADGTTLYFQSEKDGFAHLYTRNLTTSETKQLTSGKFEVSDVRLSQDKSKFFFTSTEASPHEQHLYSMPVGGGERMRLTTAPGKHGVTIAPDETLFADVYSSSNKPPELYLTTANGQLQRITTSPTDEWSSHNWIEPPIVWFKARDGVEVPARMYKPANWKPGGAAVLFVHGAGYAQNVHKWWSSYFREYMFHHLLRERGYLVLDVDYRASAGYGRDWRTGIYRHMGGKDLSDHVDAVKYLVAEHGVDSKRVGLYGGSYGGFITLMALFTEPDVFAAGAALRPVTDWAHYNHGYTSNILNQPQDDAEAYKRSSPIYHAQNLKGALLICHGMVDVNVHYQDSVRLVQRLIELRKENWEFASYPVEDHGFVTQTSWADEYKRILKLFETNLKPAPSALPEKAVKKPKTTK